MDRQMKVLLLNDSFPPLIDGVGNTVLNYARYLPSFQATPVVAVPEYKGVVDDYPFPVVRYPSFDTTKLVGYRTGYPFDTPTLNNLKNYNFDVIHSHCPFISTMLARTLREMIGAPIVFTYHTKFDIDIRNAIRAKVLQNAAIKVIVDNISACDEVWAVCEGAGENLRQLGYEGTYRVMRNGVDMPNERAAQELIDEASAQYDLTEAPVFLFVGRIMWYKGLRLILDALSGLKKKDKAFTMLFVGTGNDMEEVQAYAKEVGVYENCRFAGAVRDREKLRAIYSRADLFLFPSTFDNNPLVVHEAAACGLASLLIRGSSAAEEVEDGVNAILTEENAESIYDALLAWMDRLDNLHKLGQNAQDMLYFTWEDSVAQAHNRYVEVLDSFRLSGSRRASSKFESLYTFESDWANMIGRMIDFYKRFGPSSRK